MLSCAFRILMLPALLAFAFPLRAQDGTLQALQNAVKANPKDPNAHYNLGVEHLKREQYDLAAESLEKAVKLNSKDKQAMELLEMARGISAFFKRDYARAIKHFKSTLKINPKNLNANMLLGNAYLEKGDVGKAEKALQAFAAAFPENAEAQRISHQNLAKIYIAGKRYPEAVTALQKVLAADPGNTDALQDLGVAYYQMKDYAQASKVWEKAVARKSDPQVHKFLGFSYYRLGKFQEAIDHYEKSIRGNPQDAETHYNVAVAYFDNGLYDEAADAFGKAFQLNPNDSNAAIGQAQAIDAAVNHNLERGSAAYLNGEYSRAIAAWEKVLQYQPSHPEAKAFLADARSKMQQEVDRLYAAGLAEKKRGRTVEALKLWSTALEMDPDNAKVKRAMAQVKAKRAERTTSLVGQGDDLLAALDYEGAIDKYEQARAEDPSNAAARAKLAKAKAAQKSQYEKYFRDGEKAAAQGDYRKAIRAFETAQRIQPGPAVRNALFQARSDLRARVASLLAEGREFADAGKSSEARKKLTALLALDPDHKEANELVKKLTGQKAAAQGDAEAVKKLYYKGVEKYIAGDVNEAIALWKKCLDMDPNYTNAKLNIDKAYAKLNSLRKLDRN